LSASPAGASSGPANDHSLRSAPSSGCRCRRTRNRVGDGRRPNATSVATPMPPGPPSATVRKRTLERRR
jgi:hypothetical protein